MNRILLILLSVIFFSSTASAITESQRERLDQFAQKFLEKRKFAVGYPVNQETLLGDFYAWYMKHELYRVAMNNVSKMSYPCEVFVKARKLEFGRQCGKVRLIGCPHLGPVDPKNGGI